MTDTEQAVIDAALDIYKAWLRQTAHGVDIPDATLMGLMANLKSQTERLFTERHAGQLQQRARP